MESDTSCLRPGNCIQGRILPRTKGYDCKGSIADGRVSSVSLSKTLSHEDCIEILSPHSELDALPGIGVSRNDLLFGTRRS